MANQFKPRLTKPEAGNKFYNRIQNGGWSTAIEGRPVDKGCTVLSNCSGYNFGRQNEIAYEILGEEGVKKLFKKYGGTLNDLGFNDKMPLMAPVNGENYYDYAIKQGLTISQTPQLGATMCWQKGESRDPSVKDGYGHVATVEKVLSNDCVVTSESGYDCSNPFWTQTRYRGSNGNWGNPSDYKFLGFILNPAVSVEPDPYPVPTRVIKEGDNGEDVKWVQWKLKKLSYLPDDVDGWFGNHTLGALLVFQLKYGLEVDGVCGPATRAMLKTV